MLHIISFCLPLSVDDSETAIMYAALFTPQNIQWDVHDGSLCIITWKHISFSSAQSSHLQGVPI